MPDILVEVGGFAGGALLLFALFKVSRKHWLPDSSHYHWVNFLGAVCIIVNAWVHGAYPPVALNMCWAGISARQLWRNYRSKSNQPDA